MKLVQVVSIAALMSMSAASSAWWGNGYDNNSGYGDGSGYGYGDGYGRGDGSGLSPGTWLVAGAGREPAGCGNARTGR